MNTYKKKLNNSAPRGKIVSAHGVVYFFYDDSDNGAADGPSKIAIFETVNTKNPNPLARKCKLLGIHLGENLSLNAHICTRLTKLSRDYFV